MAQKIRKTDGRAKNGAPKGSNRGGGRKPKDPTEYKPNKATEEKRQTAKDLFLPQVPLALKAIKEVAQSETKLEAASDRLRAANMILDRAFGRPAQEHVFVGDDTKPPIRVDSGVLATVKTDDLVKAARALLRAQEARQEAKEGEE